MTAQSTPDMWQPGDLIVTAGGDWAILVARKTADETPVWLPGWWVTTRTDGTRTGGLADEFATSRGWMPFAEFCARHTPPAGDDAR